MPNYYSFPVTGSGGPGYYPWVPPVAPPPAPAAPAAPVARPVQAPPAAQVYAAPAPQAFAAPVSSPQVAPQNAFPIPAVPENPTPDASAPFRDAYGRVDTAAVARAQGRIPVQVRPTYTPPGYSFPSYSPPTAYQFPIPQSEFDRQQILQNYNTDIMGKMRGTLARVRRKAMLSKDPGQLAAYFALAKSLGINPGFSAVGRQPERMARAEAKFGRDTSMAQMFQPLSWLNQ